MSFRDRLLGRDRRSAQTARKRLQLVLIHDRAGISPGKLDALKDDLIAAISRHVEIDASNVHVSLRSERDKQRLVADIPLATSRARRRELG
ncbi:MAG TPA: cell division topological specificity factor MinE [Anaerolineae bacterium]|nr:cell division topological specificity factor MinE [Anaerolineae bacterium]